MPPKIIILDKKKQDKFLKDGKTTQTAPAGFYKMATSNEEDVICSEYAKLQKPSCTPRGSSRISANCKNP